MTVGLRTKRYTRRGLKRMRCVRCGAKASEQWSFRPCAIGRTIWRPFCLSCDLDLNRLALAFARVPEAARLLSQYEARKRQEAA